MYRRLLALVGLVCMPTIVLCDSAITSLFKMRWDTDLAGGCQSNMATLETWLSKSRELVNASLQALSDAHNPSAPEYTVARRYLQSYFGVDSDPEATAWIHVKNFLVGPGQTLAEMPWLYCNDEWLIKLSRSDAAWDENQDEILTVSPDGSMAPAAIENVYPNLLWKVTKGYVFDGNYRGKTYCTASKDNLGATQDQTLPSTVTLCPSSFTNEKAQESLGAAVPKVGLPMAEILPRSATFYHELFHLLVGNAGTPDITYSWDTQESMLKEPDNKENVYKITNAGLIRRNPESYVFFSAAYWYFQQTQ